MTLVQHLDLPASTTFGAGGTTTTAFARTTVHLDAYDGRGEQVAQLTLDVAAAEALHDALTRVLELDCDTAAYDGPCCEQRFGMPCRTCGWTGRAAS